MTTIARLTYLLLFVLASLGVSGCAPGKGDVTGKVSFKGENLKNGTVTITPKNSGAFQATIDANGSYTIKDIPEGEAKVSVSCTDEEKMAAFAKKLVAMGREGKIGGKPAPKPTPPKTPYPDGSLIPLKYNNPTTSGLTVSVERGSTITFDIPLK
jgi:hypothetical protein